MTPNIVAVSTSGILVLLGAARLYWARFIAKPEKLSIYGGFLFPFAQDFVSTAGRRFIIVILF